jgi:hypothetical protein
LRSALCSHPVDGLNLVLSDPGHLTHASKRRLRAPVGGLFHVVLAKVETCKITGVESRVNSPDPLAKMVRGHLK